MGDYRSLSQIFTLSLFVEKKGIVALFGGAGPDYSAFFADCLRKIGRKILLIRCDFQEIESLQPPAFAQLLEAGTRDYETILLWQTAPLDSTETLFLLNHCHQAIATISGEKTQQLTELMNWAYHEGVYRIGFVALKGPVG